MEANAEFERSEAILNEMRAAGLSMQDAGGILLCAVVQTCLMTADPIKAAEAFAEDVTRLARENLGYLIEARKAAAN
jgi:hypothetical protein